MAQIKVMPLGDAQNAFGTVMPSEPLGKTGGGVRKSADARRATCVPGRVHLATKINLSLLSTGRDVRLQLRAFFRQSMESE